jgi:hypothetical protein
MLSKIRYTENFPKDLIPSYFRSWIIPDKSLLYFYQNKIYGKLYFYQNKTYGKLYEKYFIIYQNKIYHLKNKTRVPVEFKNLIFYKDLDSFDQNDFSIKNKLRNQVVQLLNNNFNTNINPKIDLIGIGGEFYLYFPFLNYQNYYGYTNHHTIYQDAIYNSKLYNIDSQNFLVDYQTFNLTLTQKSDVLINLFKINQSVYQFINQNLCLINKLVIVACQEVNLKKINKKLSKIYHFIGTNNNLLRIYLF